VSSESSETKKVKIKIIDCQRVETYSSVVRNYIFVDMCYVEVYVKDGEVEALHTSSYIDTVIRDAVERNVNTFAFVLKPWLDKLLKGEWRGELKDLPIEIELIK